MNAIALLTHDHDEVQLLFKQFEATGKQASRQRQKLVQQMIVALAKHTVIEESLFYPACRAALKDVDGAELVLELLEAHHVVNWQLHELSRMKPSDERFKAKVMVLIANVKQHIREEERALFPKVKRLMGKAHLQALGAAMEQQKASAPSKPHPRAPDHPPGILLAAPLAALADRATDAVKGTVRRRRRGREAPHTTH